MHTRFGRSWFKFVLLAVVGIAVGGLVVMLLWNWLAPTLFEWRQITYLQALGLLVLTRILFRGQPNIRAHWRAHMEERWKNMSTEEREKFQKGMRCCWWRGKPEEKPGE